MTPNEMQDLALMIQRLYAKAEDEILARIAKRLARDPESELWEHERLAEIRAVQAETRDALKALESASKRLRDSTINSSYLSGKTALEAELAQSSGLLKIVREPHRSTILALQNELTENFNVQHSAILRCVDDEYRSIIAEVVALHSAGVLRRREAIAQALNRFADMGITSFVDRSGRHWEMDTYAAMAVRTAIRRAAIQGYKDYARAHDKQFVIISEHEDTCPLCMDWERKVLALDEADAGNPECDGTLADAEGAGLFHPNCDHSMSIYIPGVTKRGSAKRASGRTPEMDVAGYRIKQKQRYMERTIRKWKRRQAVATNPYDERLANAYVRRWQSLLAELVSDHNLRRQYEREGGRVKLSDEALKMRPFRFDNDGRIIPNAKSDKR